MDSDNLILIIILFVLLIVSAGFNFNQYSKNKELSASISVLTVEKNTVTTQTQAATNDVADLKAKINDYFDAEGKTCDKDAEQCLEEFTLNLRTTVSRDCLSTSDGICPRWCGYRLDYDCCITQGYQWVSGQGCTLTNN
jgi:hypothetical protein